MQGVIRSYLNDKGKQIHVKMQLKDNIWCTIYLHSKAWYKGFIWVYQNLSEKDIKYLY